MNNLFKYIISTFIKNINKHIDVQSEFEKAADEMKESKIIFAQVDCSLEQELCINNGVDKYPKFELHRDEDILEFRYKENTVENFKTFIQR